MGDLYIFIQYNQRQRYKGIQFLPGTSTGLNNKNFFYANDLSNTTVYFICRDTNYSYTDIRYYLMWVRRPRCMNLLFVLPEGVQIKKSLWVGSTGQLYTQVGLVHMGTNGHMRGGSSYTAPLNLTLINPLGTPTLR